jgi:hypothetical protein
MNTLKQALIAGGCAALLVFGSGNAMAQGQGGQGGGRGNFDPAQFRQRMLERVRDQMEIKDDKEWTEIETRLGKVMDAQRELMAGRMPGFGRGGGRRGGNNANPDNNAGGPPPRNRFGGEPSPAMEALQKAVDDKAPTAEIKAKLKATQDEFKAKRAKLEAAQEDLRSLLTPRQEAVATLNGMLQ